LCSLATDTLRYEPWTIAAARVPAVLAQLTVGRGGWLRCADLAVLRAGRLAR